MRVAVEVRRREGQGKGGPVTYEESKRGGEMVQTLRRIKAGESQGHSASRLRTGSWEHFLYMISIRVGLSQQAWAFYLNVFCPPPPFKLVSKGRGLGRAYRLFGSYQVPDTTLDSFSPYNNPGKLS